VIARILNGGLHPNLQPTYVHRFIGFGRSNSVVFLFPSGQIWREVFPDHIACLTSVASQFDQTIFATTNQ